MLTDELREHLLDIAEEGGHDPDEFLAAAEAEMASAAEEQARAPGKNDEAGGDAKPTGAESGAKAHGGRGYFAYEYPFLKVNEVRASLFLDKIADGEQFTGEWLAKHGGATAPAAPPADE